MLKNIVRSLIRDEQGQDMVEYALVACLLSILGVVVGNAVRGL